MGDNERGNIRKTNLIDEIKARDIYTLDFLDKGPTLPSALFTFGESLVDRESIGKKSNLKCRSIMKKLSVLEMRKSLLNLPALTEEEDNSYHPAFPVSADDIQDYNKEIDPKQFKEVNMTSKPQEDDDESWVDLSKHASQPSPSHTADPMSITPDRVTPPPFWNGEEYLRLLRDAQKESNQSSARVSLSSSRRDTPRDSPKSPPNSPNTELADCKEDSPIRGFYINYYNRDGEFIKVEKDMDKDWIWDWSSRPDQSPPKEWRFVHPKSSSRRGASIRRLMVGNNSLFSRDVLYTLFITNVLSLLLGTGIGIWLSKKSGGGDSVHAITAVSLN